MARSEVLAAYPLAWPENWPRHKGPRRDARFRGNAGYNYSGSGRSATGDLTMAEAMKRVHTELQKLGVNVFDDCVISTNLKTNMSGLPRSDQGEPADPGAAIYWQKPGQPMRVMAIDIYSRTRDNVAAVAATLEAMRKIERHGGAQIMDRAFAGFAALAPPSGPSWWVVLGLNRDTATPEQIRAAHRSQLTSAHPDAGGTHDRMAELNRARDQALQEKQP